MLNETVMTVLLDCADTGVIRTAYHSRVDGLLDVLTTPPSAELLAMSMRQSREALAERQYRRAVP